MNKLSIDNKQLPSIGSQMLTTKSAGPYQGLQKLCIVSPTNRSLEPIVEEKYFFKQPETTKHESSKDSQVVPDSSTIAAVPEESHADRGVARVTTFAKDESASGERFIGGGDTKQISVTDLA